MKELEKELNDQFKEIYTIFKEIKEIQLVINKCTYE